MQKHANIENAEVNVSMNRNSWYSDNIYFSCPKNKKLTKQTLTTLFMKLEMLVKSPM